MTFHPMTMKGQLHKLVAITMLAAGFFASHVSAQTDRGVGVRVKATNGQMKEVKLYDASYALVIGNSSYTNGWDTLAGVANDVKAVGQALERQGFKVEIAENLTRQQFDERLRQFIDDHGYEPNNRLLIYYAGHGHTLKSSGDGRELGYVVPVDAPNPERDETGFRRRAVSMDTIQTYAKEIQSKHALFVFDSCFSGKLVSRNAIVIPPIIQENVAFPVRQFITAGAANQPVPDESIFRRSFVRALDGEADRNNDGYITGTELAEYLKDKVTNYSNRAQTPQYGKINDVELDRGDFVFVLPTAATTAVPNETAKPATETAAVEKEFWEAIKNSTNADDFRLYKEKYPNGTYLSLADLSLARLTRNEAKPIEAKPAEAKQGEVKSGGVKSEPASAAVQALNRARAFHQKLNLDAAIREYTKAIEIDPRYALAYTYRASVYYASKNPQAAIADLSKAIELDPGNAVAYISRGGMYSMEGDLDAAIADLNKAIEIDPRNPDAYSNRGFTYSKKKDYSAALRDLSKLLEIQPTAFNYMTRATVYDALGQKDLADADRQKAQSLMAK